VTCCWFAAESYRSPACTCAGLQPGVQQVFEISGFTGIFTLFPTLEKAFA